MKRFTLFKGIIAMLLLVAIPAGKSSAQAVSASPQNIIKPIGLNTVTVFLDRTGSNGSWNGGSGTYVWSVAPSATGVTFGSYSQTGGSAGDVTVTFSSAASGVYTFTLTRGATSRSVTVTVCNIVASLAPDSSNTNRGTWVGGFLVSNGTLAANANGQKNMFDNNLDSRASAIAINSNGFIYYIENVSGNSGSVTVTGRSANGSSTFTAATGDINGAGNGSSLGFVRLGISQNGIGYIIASDGSSIYLSQFAANGTAGNSITSISSNVPISGIGSVATFQNGDLCVAANGNLLVLANNGTGQTVLYALNPTAPVPTLVTKFQVNDNTNNPFVGTVNGIAFDLGGNLYMSSNADPANSGLFFISQGTVNTGSGTVQATQVWVGDGITDLGSNLWPNTILLPVRFGDFTVVKDGNNAVLNWTTLTEANTDHFEIERSFDGVNFVTAGTKAASGTSNDVKSYQFTDPIATGSKIIYYRLKAVDVDANGAYGKIAALRLNGSSVKDIAVYPNPFTSDLKLQISSEKQADIMIRITNAAGIQVYNRRANLQSGENIIVLSSELQTLQTGMYLMEIITKEGKTSQKIIKR